MDANWTKVNFQDQAKQQGGLADLLQLTHEVYARELGLSLSAFLRCSVSATYKGAKEVCYGELQPDDAPSCFGIALTGPDERRLTVELQHSVLFPLVGIALGAKAGNFEIPDRRPTEIEVQIVSILFRLILSEAYRAWSPVAKIHLETRKLEIEHAPVRAFQQTDLVLVLQFDVTVGENTGQLAFLVPSPVFAAAVESEDAVLPGKPEATGSPEAALQLMLPAKISVGVWLDGSHMRLRELLQLREGQVIKLDHPVERKALCTLNGKAGFSGQIVSTGARRAFMVEDPCQPQA